MKNDYITSEEGKIFVRTTKCGIPTLVIYSDALPISTFKNLKSVYIAVSDVLEWYKNELEYGLEHGYDTKSINKYKDAIKICTDVLKEENQKKE